MIGWYTYDGLLHLVNFQFEYFIFFSYKFVCIVTLGEKYMQGYCDIFKCLWDMSKDSFANYLYDTATLFVSAVLFAVYFD